MKNSIIFSAIFAILFSTLNISAQTFTSAINGAQAIPANNSSAVGAGTVILNSAETNVSVNLSFAGLSARQTSAQIQNSTGIVFTLPNGSFSQNFAVTPAQVVELKAGQWFFNIGSSAFPNGEIRGRIAPVVKNNAVPFPFSNGSLDPSFDVDGILNTRIGAGADNAQAVAVQSDGKIVVGGYCRNTNDDFTVARYNPNGSLDTTFGSNGIVITQVGTGDDQALALAIQPDGKILLAGQVFNGANFDIGIVRYNPNGALDTSFDGDGIVITPIGSFSEVARSIALQPDGKIVVVGQTFTNPTLDIAVVRYNPNGSLDSTFIGNSGTGNGIVTTGIGIGTDTAYGVAVQPDGKIVVAGYYFNGTNNDAVVLRYNTDGVLDTSFGANGIVSTAVSNGRDEALSLALQPDGKIVIAGCNNRDNLANDFLVVRYNANGSLDASFGTNGATVTPIGNGADIALGVAIQADGKIVAAGFSFNGADNDFAVVRLNPNGTLDNTFDGDGRLTTPIGISTDSANGVAIQADGKIVVAGRTVIGSTTDFGVVRYGYGINTQTNDGFFNLNDSTAIRFDNATTSGVTSSASLNSLALPPLPAGLNLLTAPRNLQTSASFTGEILVRFTLPSRIDAANFNAAQVLQLENGVWIDRTANVPVRDFPTRTIYARVSSLSVFAIVSPLAQVQANVGVSGRVLSSNGKPLGKAVVTLIQANGQTRYAVTNPFGYFRFFNVGLRETFIFNATAKSYNFSPQIVTVNDEIGDLNFVGLP